MTPKEEQIAQMLATGATIKSIAGVVGLSESHAYRKNHDPLIKARVDEIRRQLVDRTIGKLVKSAAKAVLTLVKLLDPPASDAVRVSAAKAILSELLAVGSYAEMNERIAELEKRINEHAQLRAACLRNGSAN